MEALSAGCLNNQGALARYRGDLRLATALHEESLALMLETGDTAMVSYMVRPLAKVMLQQGDYQRAAELFRESLRLSHETGFRWVTVECLVGLAGVSTADGNYDRAARLFGAAAALREAIGDRLAPQEQADYDRRLAFTRKGLGDASFAAAWAEGQAMTLEQAIEYALAAGANGS